MKYYYGKFKKFIIILNNLKPLIKEKTHINCKTQYLMTQLNYIVNKKKNL